ncbi:MAG: IS66 family transposase [Bacteroidetes bacterium]|nr:IS66 family transposase [Bacteroidota bacterium]
MKKIILEQSLIIADLKSRLDRSDNPKNSNNSSIPPSHDYSRQPKTKSLRESSGKKPGGQPGHEGTTLEMVHVPDKIIEHIPAFCNCCGRDMSNIQEELIERRQEVVLPEIKPIFVEHQVFQRTCVCGHTIVADFPSGITPGVSYGHNIESLVAYMNARQFVPFHRLAEMFRYVFNTPISEGALVSAINRVAQKAVPAYELIRKRVETAKVNGGDETGMKIKGEKGWFWTLQGKLFTFIIASLNRGSQTLDENFPKGFGFSVLVHDCWRCYFKVTALAHQICLAHLLREFNHVSDCYKIKWATDFKQLLVETIAFKKTLLPEDYDKLQYQRTEFEERLDKLLQEPINDQHPIAISLQDRLIKYRQHIFTFLYYHQVPPDNNGSERAIRNVKVKQKISGMFMSLKGAQSFAILRSVIDTAIKNNQNPLVALSQINAL